MDILNKMIIKKTMAMVMEILAMIIIKEIVKITIMINIPY